jgi:hypothetical protein
MTAGLVRVVGIAAEPVVTHRFVEHPGSTSAKPTAHETAR